MVVVYKVFKGQDSVKKACSLILSSENMSFDLLYDKAKRRKDEKTEKEIKEVAK